VGLAQGTGGLGAEASQAFLPKAIVCADDALLTIDCTVSRDVWSALMVCLPQNLRFWGTTKTTNKRNSFTDTSHKPHLGVRKWAPAKSLFWSTGKQNKNKGYFTPSALTVASGNETFLMNPIGWRKKITSYPGEIMDSIPSLPFRLRGGVEGFLSARKMVAPEAAVKSSMTPTKAVPTRQQVEPPPYPPCPPPPSSLSVVGRAR